MSKKVYQSDQQGGIRFVSERKSGEVRIPNYVYDLWTPILGVEIIGIYSIYCRLERETIIKGISQNELARQLRIGVHALRKANELLEHCGFIQQQKPTGVDKLKHFTTQIIVCDAPQNISADIINELALKNDDIPDYKPLSHWLLESNPAITEVQTSNAGDEIQQCDEVQTSNATIASLMLHPSDIVIDPPIPPKRGKREKVTNPDTIKENECITAIIQGYINGLSIVPATNQYGNKTTRRAALAIHRAGYTPAQVTRYTEHLQAQLFWQGKKPPLTTVAEGIAAYCATHKPKPVFEIPEGHYDPALDDGTPATPEQIAAAKAQWEALLKAKNGNTKHYAE